MGGGHSHAAGLDAGGHGQSRQEVVESRDTHGFRVAGLRRAVGKRAVDARGGPGGRRLDSLTVRDWRPRGCWWRGADVGMWGRRGDSGVRFSGCKKVPRTSDRTGLGWGCSPADHSQGEDHWGGGGQGQHFGNHPLCLMKTTQAFQQPCLGTASPLYPGCLPPFSASFFELQPEPSLPH